MTSLSDTQLTILSAAAQRPHGNLLPLPGSLRGGATSKVVGALLGRGLVREEVTDSTRPADAALNTIWRHEEDGRAVLLRVTAAGFKALGIQPAASPIAEAPQRPGAGHADSLASAASPERGGGRRPLSESPSAPAGQEPRGHHAPGAHRRAAAAGGPDDRRGGRSDRLAAAHGPRSTGRRAEEAPRPDDRIEKVENRGRVYRLG